MPNEEDVIHCRILNLRLHPGHYNPQADIGVQMHPSVATEKVWEEKYGIRATTFDGVGLFEADSFEDIRKVRWQVAGLRILEPLALSPLTWFGVCFSKFSLCLAPSHLIYILPD